MEERSATNDIDMGLSDDDHTPQIYAEPPARLAARFYRKSTARRKSSANSSRRSSLSSIHSHSSALSSHGGPHSSHIAQHLRRASIIESRKARLADRAAHAEQVRLRAATAKASQRNAYSEEKSLAAQAAREKLLADIAARCEEEVRRAKKIAGETKEKKAAELARLKEEMAEKFAEAARRKSLYQQGLRRPRSGSLAAVEERKAAPVTLKRSNRTYAAKVIQRAWRLHQRRKVLADFARLQLNLASAKELSFEDLTRLVATERTTTAATALLRHLGVLEVVQEETESVRIFLSSYVILAHPVPSLSHAGNDPQEQQLIEKAKVLVEYFESYLRKTSARPHLATLASITEPLGFYFNDFCSTFDAWKSKDLNVLVDVMVSSFVNLDLILQATKNDRAGHVADDYLDAVRQEQIKLLARLKRLAGSEEALSRVRLAVRKARKQYASENRRKELKQVPRATGPTTEATNSAQPAPITPPATPRSDVREQSPKTSSITDSLGQIMTVLPSNREIAHEIQINGTFEVQQRPWTDARKDLMDSLQTSMRNSMQDGSGLATTRWTHAMAVLIREKLINLVSPRHPLYDRIDGFLDPTLITQQCRNGMFSYDSFFETIARIIAQICSPGRDEAVAAFSSSRGDTIERLFDLINIIDLMTLDHINFQFRLASQSVAERGHEHEIVSFERELQDEVHSLERTKHWWETATSNLSPANLNGNSIYARGLVDLVFRNAHLEYQDFPETLQLDYIRMLKLRARVFQTIATSSILLTTKIRLRRNRESLWTKDAERLMALDFLTTGGERVVSLVSSSHIMPDSTKEGVSNFVSRVLPPAVAAARQADLAEHERQDAIHSQSIYDPSGLDATRSQSEDIFTEQIASFLLKSLREHVFARLSATGTTERVRMTTGAAEFLARIGMPEFLEEVNRMVTLLEKIRTVDLKAHGRWYDQIADGVGA
ncbi:uncharacterized protein A1O9_08634 [Exophiala aquamarina CBS 119918]|uniref:Uncharacterized protein n=1 Tax=Exophiala aquamarina CBS 119918 TaxID=1182545 RepID=A0A072P5I2_9EURO|nr:uncharacterized protein A1O9_08634 [Exophiala aquamarina CBS 119918]KEF54982.1 hypothetical protein A1O9_08634 [Exophiala aquamarina CBS 119918]